VPEMKMAKVRVFGTNSFMMVKGTLKMITLVMLHVIAITNTKKTFNFSRPWE